MQLLRQGSTGNEVELWQNFLRGRGQAIVADGAFGLKTKTETQRFQNQHKLGADGVVGARTWGKALSLGLGGVLDEDEDGADFPPRPATLAPYLSNAERAAAFGAFEYEAAPTASNPEAIRVLGNWSGDNIVRVSLRTLADPNSTEHFIRLHKDVAESFHALISAWTHAGLFSRVTSWNGGYVPRFIRGSTSTLSAHAWGTAFDVNAPQNRLGVVPALKGTRGSVRELVALANEHGFWWGGHYRGRLDGQHFEAARKL